MASEPKRAQRIRHKERLKARVRRIAKNEWDTSIDFWRSEEDRQRWLNGCEKLVDHLQHCRKRCCNKPRFWDGPTIQERRAEEAARDQIERLTGVR